MDTLNQWLTLFASLTVAVGGFTVGTAWVVKRVVNGTLNSRFDSVDERLSDIEDGMASHSRKHDHEQGQLMAALARQGFELPNGWDTPTAP